VTTDVERLEALLAEANVVMQRIIAENRVKQSRRRRHSTPRKVQPPSEVPSAKTLEFVQRRMSVIGAR